MDVPRLIYEQEWKLTFSSWEAGEQFAGINPHAEKKSILPSISYLRIPR